MIKFTPLGSGNDNAIKALEEAKRNAVGEDIILEAAKKHNDLCLSRGLPCVKVDRVKPTCL